MEYEMLHNDTVFDGDKRIKTHKCDIPMFGQDGLDLLATQNLKETSQTSFVDNICCVKATQIGTLHLRKLERSGARVKCTLRLSNSSRTSDASRKFLNSWLPLKLLRLLPGRVFDHFSEGCHQVSLDSCEPH